MTSHLTTWRLAYARRSLLRARAALADPSPFAPADAVAAAQDGVELVLWALATENGWLPAQKPKHQIAFLELLNSVPAARPFSHDLQALNGLRVQAKHHGSAPGRSEAVRQVEAGIRAASTISASEPPNVNVLNVSLADALRNRLCGDSIAEAERLVSDDSGRRDFAIALARVRYHAQRQAESSLEIQLKRSSFALSRRYHVDGQAARGLDALEDETHEAFDQLTDYLSIQYLVPDRKRLLMMDRLLPRVSYGYNGDERIRWGEEKAQLEGLTALVREEVLGAALQMAERADELDFDGPLTPFRELTTVEAVQAVEARTVGGKRLAGHLEPGRRYPLEDMRDAEAVLRMFGVFVAVPRTAVAERPSTD